MARDGQIKLPDGGAPVEYTVPNATEIIPRVVSAVFDGTGAAGSFVPTVEIVSDGGVVVARVPCQTTVSAGGSCECTFAPFLRGEQAATPSGSGGVPYAAMTYVNGAFADSGFSLVTVSCAAASFVTTDATVFAVGTTGGVTGITLKTTGQYRVVASAVFQISTPPAAGSMAQTFTSSGIARAIAENDVAGWLATDAFGTYQANVSREIEVPVQSPSNPAPTQVNLMLGQNSGGVSNVSGYLTAIQLNTGTI